MSTKKSNTSRKSATNQQPTIGREALRQELARDLASILDNPETPAGLYNAIADEVCEWSEAYCSRESKTAPFIERCLDAHLADEQKRKGGAR